MPPERTSARDKVPAEVRGLRSFGTSDGYAYSGTLYLSGKRVGTVRNDGNGGETWVKRADMDRDAYAVLEAAVSALPPDRDPEYGDIKVSMDYFLASLCEDEMERQNLDRLAKRSVLYRLPDMPNGEWMQVKAGRGQAWDATKAREQVVRKHPNAVFYEPRPKAKAKRVRK